MFALNQVLGHIHPVGYREKKEKKRSDKECVTKLIVGGVSPFNIADQVELPPFSLKNIHEPYAQYTEETNQPFTQSAVKKVCEETAGQPWLLIIFIKRDISKRFLAMRNYLRIFQK